MAVERIKKDIIDNDDNGEAMGDILLTEIPNSPHMDVSTGYFDVGGYGILRDAIEGAVSKQDFRLRLMLGKDAILPKEGSFERYAEQYREAAGSDASLVSIKTSLDAAKLDPGSLSDIASLVRILESDSVEVRMGASRFNHAKCYIFGDNAAFIGSSNLTRAGMHGNHELNAGIYQPLSISQVQRWFDRMWNAAEDRKEDLISVLRQSKFGIPPDPYEVYMKMLFETYKPLLQQDESRLQSSVALTLFQQDAVRTVVHLMNTYQGAIIADSTGLGKTNMGIEIIRQKMLNEGRRVMLVAPAQVLDSMWAEKLREADITVRQKASMEKMGRDDFLENPSKYHKIDLIIIDESQNFRSKYAQRRRNLMKLLTIGRPKQVLLLTATPINNSLMDLYYQLSIITGGKNDYFWSTIGIPDLYKHMRNAANRDLQSGLEKIQQLLDAVMIRRTRSFIKEAYPNDTINGRPIRFPKHEYKPIRYDLASLFGNIFDKMFNDISSLTMAPYGIEQYNKRLDKNEQAKYVVLAHLQIILLLKRFESSIEAVKISLANKIRMYEHVKRTLEGGKILRVSDFNRVILKWTRQEIDDEDGDEERRENELIRDVEGVATEDAGRYDTDKMINDMRHDLKILHGLRDAVNDVTIDKKFDSVHETLRTEKALEREGRKVLMFTEYTATAKYLHKRLSEAFPSKNVLLIHGGTRTETRQKYIRSFAPRSNLPEDEQLEGSEADILVSTEVLSEGQNLQDCNYVVNYDLPWNPMRIVQRTGRIDRLTSEYKTVRSRACYPDQQLDSILNLVGKLMDKINMVDVTIGLDEELLGKLPNPKQYNGRLTHDIRALAGIDKGGDAVAERLTRESDIMPQATPKNEIDKHVKEIGFEAMQSVPMGRRSGKKGEGQKAVLAYLQEKPARRVHFVVYDYARGEAYIPDSDTDAIRLASCAQDEKCHLPMDDGDAEHGRSFEELLRLDAAARDAIRNRDIDGRKQVVDLIHERKKPDRNLTELERILTEAMVDGYITENDAEAARVIINSDAIRSWPDKVSELLKTHKDPADAQDLAESIIKFAKNAHLDARAENGDDVLCGDEAELRLVGAMFIAGDRFDPKQGRKGMDRFTGQAE